MGLKQFVLHVSKWLGLFRLARLLSRPGLRVLCYHGYAIADESSFRPKLFMLPSTFQRRLRYLSEQHFPILDLSDSLVKLHSNSLPAGAAVITIDDGFYSVLRCAMPMLRGVSFPATVYVTTYYCLKETPVFRLIVQYIFWKTRTLQLDLTSLSATLTGILRLEDKDETYRVMWEIIRHGESQLEEPGRVILARTLANRLNVNYDSILEGRYLSLMTASELRDLVAAGVDIQLHTHRHRLPNDEAAVRKEIADNRAVLEPIAGKPLQHLCYPSGIWSDQIWPWLSALGVQSATTCDPGVNVRNTPALALKRFLDGENISQIEFESEMCGFNDLLRSARGYLRVKPKPGSTAGNERSQRWQTSSHSSS